MLRRNFKNKQQETDGKKNHYNKNKKIDEKKRQKNLPSKHKSRG